MSHDGNSGNSGNMGKEPLEMLYIDVPSKHYIYWEHVPTSRALRHPGAGSFALSPAPFHLWRERFLPAPPRLTGGTSRGGIHG